MTAYANELADPDVLAGTVEHALLAGAPWRRFVVLGDSIAAGIGDPVPGYPTLSWPERVARALRTHHPQLAYRNLGVRDLVAAEVRATQLEQALAFAPDLAAVACGGNDALRGRYDADAVERELEAIVGTLRAAGADVFLYALMDITQAFELPEPHGSRLRERMGTLAELTRRVAQRTGALLVDCEHHPRASDPTLMSADFLHLNMRGHAIVAGAAIQELSRAIAPAAARGRLRWRA